MDFFFGHGFLTLYCLFLNFLFGHFLFLHLGYWFFFFLPLHSKVIRFAHYLRGDAVGFGFILVIGVIDGHFALNRRGTGPLLNDMCQFVGNEFLSVVAFWIVGPGAEEDVVAGGEGDCA